MSQQEELIRYQLLYIAIIGLAVSVLFYIAKRRAKKMQILKPISWVDKYYLLVLAAGTAINAIVIKEDRILILATFILAATAGYLFTRAVLSGNLPPWKNKPNENKP